MSVNPDLQRAVDAVLLAGIEQKAWLDRHEHPPLYASLADAVKFYGGPRAGLSLWTMVRAVELLRVAEAMAVSVEATGVAGVEG